MPTTSRSFMRRAVPALLSSIPFLASVGTAAAQGFDLPSQDQALYELRQLSGSRVVGWITEERGDTVVFRSIDGGEWRLERGNTALRRARGRLEQGEFWREDQNHSRLFFAPTGRTLHSNQAYAGLFLVLPFVGAGMSDDVTMAGGFNPFGGELERMEVWLAPKVRVLKDDATQASVGGLYLQLPGGNPFEWEDDYEQWDYELEPGNREVYRLAIGYGVATFGSLDQAVHIGAGIAHAFGSDAATRGIGMVGGEYRLGRKYKLISENWLLVPDYPMVSLGLRSIGERWTWDYGLMALLAEEGAPYVPIISFSYAFGAGR